MLALGVLNLDFKLNEKSLPLRFHSMFLVVLILNPENLDPFISNLEGTLKIFILIAPTSIGKGSRKNIDINIDSVVKSISLKFDRI